MNQIKNIQIKLRALSGNIKFVRSYIADDADSMLNKIAEIESELKELEKMQNYNNASIVPVKKEEPYKEMVSHPDHYQGRKIECIEAMLDAFGKEKVSAFCELNAFKYQWRADKKGTDIQDKRKAIWYLDKYVELNNEKS